MNREEIDPPYRAYTLARDGTRRPLRAHSIVVELRRGVEVEIDLAPNPRFAGHLVMFTPSCAATRKTFDEGMVDEFAVVFGASNVLHIIVERHCRQPKTPDDTPDASTHTQGLDE